MLRVACCYTKRSAHGYQVIDDFAKGLEIGNDKAVLIRSRLQFNELDRCQVIVQVCGYSKHTRSTSREHLVRTGIKKYLDYHTEKIHIILDRGFLDFLPQPHLSVGIGGLKGEAKYNNKNRPMDRFVSWDRPLKPWRAEHEHAYVLILGQTAVGQSCQHIDYFQWLETTIAKLRLHTNKPIFYRMHVKERPSLLDKHKQVCKNAGVGITNYSKEKKPQSGGFDEYYDQLSLDADLRGAHAAVTYNSNAGVYALFSGVPVFSPTKSFYGYPLANHLLEDIDNPVLPAREQFFADMAYACWNHDELRSGQVWLHLKPRLYDMLYGGAKK